MVSTVNTEGFNCPASLLLCGHLHHFISNKAARHGDESCCCSSFVSPGDKWPPICHLCAAIDLPPFPHLACSLARPAHFLFFIIDFVMTFMSLFWSAPVVAVRNGSLTSISHAVALTEGLIDLTRGTCGCKVLGRLTLIHRSHEGWPQRTIKTINNSKEMSGT